MKRKILVGISWCAVACVCALIFYFSSQTATDSSLQSSWLIDWIDKLFGVGFTDFVVRKFAHAAEFATLGFFAAVAFGLTLKSAKKACFGIPFSLVYAVSDEVHQIYVPGRACQLRDVFIDLGGILLGTAVYLLFYFIIKRMGAKKKTCSKE